MAVSLPDARGLSDEVLEALRLRALRGCEMGLTEAEIADLLSFIMAVGPSAGVILLSSSQKPSGIGAGRDAGAARHGALPQRPERRRV
jgi:hypothetical protein